MTNGDLPPKPMIVLHIVAEQYGITVREIQGYKRDVKTAKARTIAAICLRDLCRLTFERTGELLGGKDHSTVMYAWRKALRFQDDIETIKARLQQEVANG